MTRDEIWFSLRNQIFPLHAFQLQRVIERDGIYPKTDPTFQAFSLNIDIFFFFLVTLFIFIFFNLSSAGLSFGWNKSVYIALHLRSFIFRNTLSSFHPSDILPRYCGYNCPPARFAGHNTEPPGIVSESHRNKIQSCPEAGPDSRRLRITRDDARSPLRAFATAGLHCIIHCRAFYRVPANLTRERPDISVRLNVIRLLL